MMKPVAGIASLALIGFFGSSAMAQAPVTQDPVFIHCSVAQLGELHFRNSDPVGFYFPDGITYSGYQAINIFDEKGVLAGARFNKIENHQQSFSILSRLGSPRVLVTIHQDSPGEYGSYPAAVGGLEDDDVRFGQCFIFQGARVAEALRLHGVASEISEISE